MKSGKKAVFFPGLAAVLLIAGCATTLITSSWRDRNYTAYPNKILVIAIAKSPSEKRSFEDDFVGLLKARGNDAIAGYAVIPDEVQEDTAAISAAMYKTGSDTLLVTRLASKDSICTYGNDPSVPNMYPSYYNTWRDYCGNVYSNRNAPYYVYEDVYAAIETNMYSGQKDDLVWSASSTSEIYGSDQRYIRSYTDVMVKTMARRHLIK